MILGPLAAGFRKTWLFQKSPTHWVLLGFGIYWFFGFFYLNEREQLGSFLVD